MKRQTTAPINTFSIVGHCPRTNMLGVGVASKYLAVGAVCSHTQAGIGAVSTQAYGNPYLGIDSLTLLQNGLDAQQTLAQVLKLDPGREKRQLIVVNNRGEAAAFTGSLTAPWCGHHQGQGYAVAGNMLTDEKVIQARGLSEAEAIAHIAIFLDPDADPPIPLLMIQDQPFTLDDAQSYAGVASRVDFVPLFVPGVAGGPTLAGLLRGENRLDDIIMASPSNIAPTTDDRPFFISLNGAYRPAYGLFCGGWEQLSWLA